MFQGFHPSLQILLRLSGQQHGCYGTGTTKQITKWPRKNYNKPSDKCTAKRGELRALLDPRPGSEIGRTTEHHSWRKLASSNLRSKLPSAVSKERVRETKSGISQ
ncbi:hypothetical protein LINPERHAP1_LOCUS27199, partial [Linum perenne]